MEEKHYKPSPNRNQESFGRVINSKLISEDQNNNFATINFNTKQFYNESLRLSLNPQEYINKQVNPIDKFYPANFNFISSSQVQ